MTLNLEAEHLEDDLFEIRIRSHVLRVDQPVEDGGRDEAPTPTELFVASLASCVGFYARRYLARHGLPTAGLAVEARFSMAERPARVDDVALVVRLPSGVPPDRRAPLLAVASHCTVHNSLRHPPSVRVDMTDQRTVAA